MPLILPDIPGEWKIHRCAEGCLSIGFGRAAAAIAQVQPGIKWNDPHQAALHILAQGFIDLGLCQGSVDAVLESEDYKRFYMHRNRALAGKWMCMMPVSTSNKASGVYCNPAWC